MGIAAGMLDGFDWPGLKGALMARGAREISRLVRAMEAMNLQLTVFPSWRLPGYAVLRIQSQ